jgi:hypothetical protein
MTDTPSSAGERELPPLPQSTTHIAAYCGDPAPIAVYTADQMRAYALAARASAAPAVQPVTSDEIIEFAEAMQVRRILEEIKKVAAIHPADDMPTAFQAAWQTCCEEIFFRATGDQWHMDEDERKFARAANDPRPAPTPADQP